MSRRNSAVSIAARVLLVPYVVALGLIVWLPSEQAGQVTGIVARVARAVGARLDVSFSTTYTLFEFAANIALFVPLGILLTVGWPGLRLWHILLLGLTTTVTIELVQFTLPSRFPTVSDVVANTVGGVLGYGLVRMFVPARSTRRPRMQSA